MLSNFQYSALGTGGQSQVLAALQAMQAEMAKQGTL